MNNTGEMNIFGAPDKPKTEPQTKKKHNDLTYDEAFKRLFSNKEILAGILINIIPEYKNLDFQDVVDLIKATQMIIHLQT